MIRAFVAIPIPKHARDALTKLQTELPIGRNIAPENMHITLVYLDKQPECILERIHEALDQMKASAFPVTLKGIDVFGGREPRVVWAGIEPNSALSELRTRVVNLSRRSGIELPRDRFRPHVTLARIKANTRSGDTDRLNGFVSQNIDRQIATFQATSFVLYRSHRHRTGAAYDPLVEYQLRQDRD